jgi:formylglycine-generating enzyme required for sulfatase activity
MVFVPGGGFKMGNDGQDGDELERPAHDVSVDPFFIDTYEVACSDYESFLRESGSAEVPDGWSGRSCPQGRERLPVTGIDWFAARAFCEGQKPAKRLPSEKEWEFAARGATGRQYPWGDAWEPGLANAGGASGGLVGRITKGTSPFGAYDMAGNAWEWTDSDLASYGGGPLPSSITRGGVTDQVVRGKVIRGGSWQDDPADVTTTIRRGYPPRGLPASGYSNTGFRCALSAP